MDASQVTATNIMASILVVTKAFERVKLSVNLDAGIVFAEVKYRNSGIYKLLKFRKKGWLKEAEGACKPFIPEGFKIHISYVKEL